AASASGSLTAAQNAAAPLRSASMNTSTSGSSRNATRKPTAPRMSSACTQRGSLVGDSGRARTAAAGSVGINPWGSITRTPRTLPAGAISAPPPAAGQACLQRVDHQQQGEGQQQHGHGDGGGAGVVEFLQLDGDQQRRDLRHLR